MERSAGVILHPSALPSTYGIGNFGAHAYEFVDFLNNSGFKHWQMCPLGPTSYGDSPYQSFSAFAGNPYFIDWDFLVEQKLVNTSDLSVLKQLSNERVEFGKLFKHFWDIFDLAFNNYKNNSSCDLKEEFELFIKANASWLIDYSNFRALKELFQNRSRVEWPTEFTLKKNEKGHNFSHIHSECAEKHAFSQFLFDRQFSKLKQYAKEKHVQIIGDLPIFVSLDSSDVWSNPHLFDLNEQGEPNTVAGVPPDYFSENGQLWGNPLYNWKTHRKDSFNWWVARIKHNLRLYDYVRIDHFRGFESCWAVPSQEATAINGTWEKAPGAELFKVLKAKLKDLPIIAEDLGIITEEVEELMNETGFPGMAVLHFAFGGSSNNPYLPHMHKKHQVVYTGTHDNNTSIAWFDSLDPQTKTHVQQYLQISGSHIGWDLIRSAFRSVADIAITPLQDLMSLGASARFNNPGTSTGNWDWRFTQSDLEVLKKDSQAYLLETLRLYGRT